MSDQRRILVFGSPNIDLVQRVARLPVPGETLLGEELVMLAGLLLIGRATF